MLLDSRCEPPGGAAAGRRWKRATIINRAPDSWTPPALIASALMISLATNRDVTHVTRPALAGLLAAAVRLHSLRQIPSHLPRLPPSCTSGAGVQQPWLLNPTYGAIWRYVLQVIARLSPAGLMVCNMLRSCSHQNELCELRNGWHKTQRSSISLLPSCLMAFRPGRLSI